MIDQEFFDNLSKSHIEIMAAAFRKYADIKTSELRALNAELLEALQEMVVRDYYSGQPEHFQRTEKARSAIAKAKGESVSPVTSEGKSE